MKYKTDGINDKISFIITLIIAFAIVGVIDAGYLVYSHYTHNIVKCSLTGGCQDVLQSSYATIYNIPIALFGLFYYLSIFTLILYYKKSNLALLKKIIFSITFLGFLISLFLLYIQIYIIKSICIYCIGSAFVSLILFILGILLVVYSLKIKNYDN